MRRVLASDGRVAVSVGQAIEHHPLHAALDELTTRHLGAPLFARTIFSLGDADHLRMLLEGAGFRGVAVEPLALTARFPDPAGFVRLQVLGVVAFASALAEMAPTRREAAIAAVLAEAEAVVRPYIEDGTLVVPTHAHVAQARA
jgi:hypothetical protein